MDELIANLQEAVEGCLSVEIAETQKSAKDRVIEIAL